MRANVGGIYLRQNVIFVIDAIVTSVQGIPFTEKSTIDLERGTAAVCSLVRYTGCTTYPVFDKRRRFLLLP